MELHVHPFELKLKHPFTIAHDSRTVQSTLIVALSDGQIQGYGEATANKYYGISIDSMLKALESIYPILASQDFTSAEQLWDLCHPHLTLNPFAQCALDEAAHDYFAKKNGVKLYEALGLDISHNVQSNYTIGIDSIEKMVMKMKELPWPIYKIKLGTPDDLEIIKALRSHTDAVFRVDANCGWDADRTIELSHSLKKLGVEFIEQPLPAQDIEGMKEVFKLAAVPIIADESCIQENDVTNCHGLFHGINIKLTKCGGITPALRMLKQAKQLGMKCMIGCMTESTVGISAIAHLLPLLDYVDMDGSLLISNDPAKGVTLDYGKVIYASGCGTGAELI
jgi:L-alanine-DL-glutamate epimerase-like enolase superfamily enzyme